VVASACSRVIHTKAIGCGTLTATVTATTKENGVNVSLVIVQTVFVNVQVQITKEYLFRCVIVTGKFIALV